MPEATPVPAAGDLFLSAAKFLIEGGDDAAAAALLACSLRVYTWPAEKDYWGRFATPVVLELRGPRVAYELLHQQGYYDEEDGGGPRAGTRVQETFEALLPHTCKLRSFETRAELVAASPVLREDLLELVRGKTVHNQAVSAPQAQIWAGLRFRSATEVKIAQALDQRGVLFLPNCLGRLNGAAGQRRNQEPDFLICQDGRWGVLEVDGEAFHPSAARDHTRDAFFQRHGIKCVKHYEATTCYQEPDEVVADFLSLLTTLYR